MRTEIIAECGVNFNGDMDLAVEMIHQANSCGADVAKFQVYDPVRLLDPNHPLLEPWWDLILSTELSRKDVGLLAETCEEVGIEFMASVFHPDRVPWLEDVGVRRYKIASRSIYDAPLAQAIAATGKPILLSHGMRQPNRFPPIQKIADGGLISHLYCVSEYPTPFENIRFSQMVRYNGFSDHTQGIVAAKKAISLKMEIVEKHFTLDRELPGPDHVCSIEPDELLLLCQFRDER